MKSDKQSNINSKRIQNELSKIHPSVAIITAYDIKGQQVDKVTLIS
jgi:hypothetical protein